MAANLYYDDQKRLIATTDDELTIYFQSLPGVSMVQNLPFVVSCPMYALYQVNSSGVLPKFISKNGTAPAQRIYPSLLTQSLGALNNLCNGVAYNNIVPPPELISAFFVAIDYYQTEDLSDYYTLPDGITRYRKP